MKIITNNVGGYAKERNNCLWYSGELINIETDYGKYKIFIDGNSNYLLKYSENKQKHGQKIDKMIKWVMVNDNLP